MCCIVVINRGEVEITTPNEFLRHFNFMPIKLLSGVFDKCEMDECLCSCNLSRTFDERKIAYKTSNGDYYIGDLENVIGDHDTKPGSVQAQTLRAEVRPVLYEPKAGKNDA